MQLLNDRNLHGRVSGLVTDENANAYQVGIACLILNTFEDMILGLNGPQTQGKYQKRKTSTCIQLGHAYSEDYSINPSMLSWSF